MQPKPLPVISTGSPIVGLLTANARKPLESKQG
jgi:hypothetical protein